MRGPFLNFCKVNLQKVSCQGRKSFESTVLHPLVSFLEGLYNHREVHNLLKTTMSENAQN